MPYGYSKDEIDTRPTYTLCPVNYRDLDISKFRIFTYRHFLRNEEIFQKHVRRMEDGRGRLGCNLALGFELSRWTKTMQQCGGRGRAGVILEVMDISRVFPELTIRL